MLTINAKKKKTKKKLQSYFLIDSKINIKSKLYLIGIISIKMTGLNP